MNKISTKKATLIIIGIAIVTVIAGVLAGYSLGYDSGFSVGVDKGYDLGHSEGSLEQIQWCEGELDDAYTQCLEIIYS